MATFGERIAEYGAWRRALSGAVQRYGDWLDDAGLSDAASRARIERIVERLAKERISIAFVAEFSRGKSELINAIFFADRGQRILPSAAGRTTMCPTELMYDRSRPSSLRLLPIETRLRDLTVSELREQDPEWREIPIDPEDPAGLAAALASVRETVAVDAAQAALLGLHDENDPDSAARPDAQGRVEVPRWRHAIVNYPHPLLELGLVVIDTPGLNAIGAEPELTLKLIPGADAVLFVLAADAGVTRSDIEVWREHISASHKSGRFVVLNKIDGLWDGLKDEVQLQIEIARQVGSVAHTLGLPNDRIYPVSAQKALVARVNRDPLLLKRSRMSDLEYALGRELVPQQRAIAREHASREFEALHAQVGATLGARRRAAIEQLFELGGLRGKNRGVMDHMAARIRRERDEFDRSLRQLQGLRAVLARHSQTLGEAVGGESLRRHVRQAREALRSSSFSTGLRSGMNALIGAVRADFERASQLVDEVATLMSAMYRSFSAEHGLSLGNPALYSMRRFHAELDRIDQLQRRQFGAITLATTSQQVLMRRFFESVASRLRELEEIADREIQAWLRTVMSPIETQVREHQAQLRQRLDAVRRVLEANDSLESRIHEIERQRAEVEQRIALAAEFALQVRELLAETTGVAEVAAD
ncbi:MAG: GTPase [Lautropia sp.]|nr:MAG: GTPase [Pseudomonadota bacterium]MBC6960812.1 GTPase [Lautropia sp.]MCL4701766.1 dynamin family protein [Burkholderiaceae bacterium]MCZ2413286.1 dynamin family protein [Burkholderiales bacterium]MDL1908786.1 GTPase [Betaproteobacteria bacterium PRO1]